MSYNPHLEAIGEMSGPTGGGEPPRLFGFGDPERYEEGRYAGPPSQTPTGDPLSTETQRPPIYEADVIAAIRGMDEQGQQQLALEMFAYIPGAYRDVDEVFFGDGTLNPVAFTYAVGRALDYAHMTGPEGLLPPGEGENSDYLKTLLGQSGRDIGELAALFQAGQRRSRGGGGGGGGGRVINYIDPVALQSAAKQAFAGETGRYATLDEQRAFVKTIHQMQASGATSIQVAPQAEAFARAQAPAEAKAMDYANAAGLVMQALGM